MNANETPMPEQGTHTPGPYSFRMYATDDDPADLRKHAIEPVRALDNDGQISIVAGTGNNKKRIALVDCQTLYKRGLGHKTECVERDANARLFAAAPDMKERGNILASCAKDFLTDGSDINHERLSLAIEGWNGAIARAIGAA